MVAKEEKVLQPLLVESLYIGDKKRINKKDKVSWALGISREPTYIYIPENKRAVILKRKNQILKNIGTCYLVDNLLGYHVPTKE